MGKQFWKKTKDWLDAIVTPSIRYLENHPLPPTGEEAQPDYRRRAKEIERLEYIASMAADIQSGKRKIGEFTKAGGDTGTYIDIRHGFSFHNAEARSIARRRLGETKYAEASSNRIWLEYWASVIPPEKENPFHPSDRIHLREWREEPFESS